MKRIILLAISLILLVACTPSQARSAEDIATKNTPQANLPNPASENCEQRGGKLEIRTATDGSQSGVCVCSDGSECDEWAYYRGECAPAGQNEPTVAPPAEPASPQAAPMEIPTAIPIDPAAYQGWWTYTQAANNFSIMLPEDWIVEEVTASDPLTNGHLLSLHPKAALRAVSIRMTFRKSGEDALLWPTGVGQGEFIQQGTLDVAGAPVRRVLLVCPTGEVTSIYYQAEDQANIIRGDQEFGFIFRGAPSHCESGYSLSGKAQLEGEMIIASLKVP